MGELQLVYAGGDYDHTRALADGTVRPEAIDLTYVHLLAQETFWRMQRYQAFDASELGMSGYIGLVARGNCPFVAIHAFVSRSFQHGCRFVNSATGIRTPVNLRGKRVGLPNYGMAAALWLRGMLQHDWRSVYEAHPWVAPNLLTALEASKQLALERAYDYDALRYPLPWLISDLEELRQLMGQDHCPAA